MNYKPLPELIPFNELSDHPGEALLQAVHDLKIAIGRVSVKFSFGIFKRGVQV